VIPIPWIWAILAVLVIAYSLLASAPGVAKRVAKDIGLEETDSLQAIGRWNGRDVSLGLSSVSTPKGARMDIRSDGIGVGTSSSVATAAIAATSSCRFRA